MQLKWIDAYMDTAERFAQLSSAIRLKVGSVIVKDHRIISIGYNGTPAGWDNACEDENNKTKPEVIHAEANAVTKLARDGESGKGAVLFCTHAPCIDCAKLIFGSGISKVFYRDVYKNEDGIRFLEQSNVDIEQYPSADYLDTFCGR